jgi:hypothetical protein
VPPLSDLILSITLYRLLFSSSSSLNGLSINACSELIYQPSSSLHLRRGRPTLRLPRGLYSLICLVNLSLFILSVCCFQSVPFSCHHLFHFINRPTV